MNEFDEIVKETQSMIKEVRNGLYELIKQNERLTAKWEDLYERLNK